MATPQSPSRIFNGLDDDFYNDAKFAHEINDKMRVPKRIRATGEYSDEDFMHSNQNGLMNSWNYHDKIDMNVPDRIIVLGHDQHLETRSAPLEIQLENSMLPKAPAADFVRVQTPPRVITLNDHHFPSASESETSVGKLDNDDDDEYYNNDEMRPPSYVMAKRSNANVIFNPNSDAHSTESDTQLTSGGGSTEKRSQVLNTQQQYNHDMSMLGDLTPHEEMLYLRRHLAKLNRRVLNIEISNEQRVQREKIVYCLGLAYFVLKAILWLNRN